MVRAQATTTSRMSSTDGRERLRHIRSAYANTRIC